MRTTRLRRKLIKSGKFEKALGHVLRTHGINLSFSHECYKKGLFDLKDCHTKAMCADIFTKAFSDPDAWTHARLLLGISTGVKTQKACALTLLDGAAREGDTATQMGGSILPVPPPPLAAFAPNGGKVLESNLLGASLLLLQSLP